MNARPSLIAAVERLPLGSLGASLAGTDHYLVGGAVRDMLRGEGSLADIDIAVDGDVATILGDTGPGTAIDVEESHVRFGTARALVDGIRIDLARTRAESYPAAGALPEVSPARIDEDLARRDFSVNAMAVPLGEPAVLIDPFGGLDDLEARVLRVLHERSFVDDPTRALRAARYAARLGFEPEKGTLGLLRRADLGTVSEDRQRRELQLIAEEACAARAFELLAAWGLIELPRGCGEMIASIERLADGDRWRAESRAAAILIAVEGGARLDDARRLGAANPGRPSAAVALAGGHDPAELLVAAAAGAAWVPDYVDSWSGIRLEIDGEDLLAAGVPEGPAIGAGLRGALARRLDGELPPGRDAELEAALAIAHGNR